MKRKSKEEDKRVEEFAAMTKIFAFVSIDHCLATCDLTARKGGDTGQMREERKGIVMVYLT